MLLKNKNLYHPFTKSELEFFVEGTLSTQNDTQFVLKNIDLYHQPVEEPAFAILYLVLGLILLIGAETLHVMVFYMVKRENGLVKEVTQIYSVCSIIMCPFWFIVPAMTDFIHPLNEVIGEWFCFLVLLLTWFHLNVITMQSFFISLMRYRFIVHEEIVIKYGKKKTKRIYTFLSIFIPLLMAIWEIVENTELDPFLFINRCYGRDHRVFLFNISPLKMLNPYYCEFGEYNDEGMYGRILELFKRASCIFKSILTILMASNISEGIIYYKIFSHNKRFVLLK